VANSIRWWFDIPCPSQISKSTSPSADGKDSNPKENTSFDEVR
jgi:hypothetical protein